MEDQAIGSPTLEATQQTPENETTYTGPSGQEAQIAQTDQTGQGGQMDQTVPNQSPNPQGYNPQSNQTQELPLSEIFSDDSFNSRGKLMTADYLETSKSMAKIGLIQAIVVQPWTDPGRRPDVRYRIVVGHCRYAAAKHLKWPTIRAEIKNFTPDEAFYTNVMENLNRVQLNIKQEAKLVDVMLRRGMRQEEICKKLDKPSQWVFIRSRILQLPTQIQDELIIHQFSSRQLNQLVRLASVPRQYAMIREMKEKKSRAEEGVTADYLALSQEFSTVMRERRPRKANEITSLKNKIYDAFGATLATRVLAWADVTISTDDVYNDLEKAAVEEGVVIKRPFDTRDLSNRNDM